MRTTGTSRRDTAIALACALVLHAGLGWGLHQLLGVAAPLADAEALQLVWIAAVPVPVPAVAPPVTRVAPRGMARAAARPPPAAAPVTAAAALPTAQPGKPLSVVAIEQTLQWQRQREPIQFAGADPLADPLADRVIRLPGRPADRIRMPPPLTVADAVGLIGVAFGAGADDPCQRNREEIAGHAAIGGDATALAMALDFERHCRP